MRMQRRYLSFGDHMTLHKTLLGLVAGTVLAVSGAFAQSYPERQINMVVPFLAGGSTDDVARVIVDAMSADLGQQIVVENINGAGGTLGAGKVASAEPDGYTVLLHTIYMATSDVLYSELPYDTLTAFEYVGLVTDVPMIIVARKDFPPGDFNSLIDYLKANAATVTMATATVGGALHLCGMLFMSEIETQLKTVPYSGSSPAMNDLLAGRFDFMCVQATNSMEHIKDGAIKAYAVTTPARLAVLPDLPTAIESGLLSFDVSVWHGIFTPKGTPAAVNERLSAALQKALANPDVIARFAELGTEPSAAADATPAALRARLEAEIPRWKTLQGLALPHGSAR